MVKKNQTHKNSESNHKEHVESRKNESSNNGVITAVLVLMVIQVILSIGILAVVMSGSSAGIDSNTQKQIDSINSKVSDIDSFFRENVQGYGSGTGSGNSGNENEAAPVEIGIEGEPMLGDPNAPITIVEFSDYECPFCKRFFEQTYGQIKAEYIDTGKAKLVFKDFPLGFHEMAQPAAVAAECVYRELGDVKYFEMHDKIFENQEQLSEQNLKAWALEVGASENSYDQCVSNPEVVAEVQGDLAEGSQNGVSGTPSFFIDGELIVGAQPFSAFKQIIDSKLE